MAVYERIREIGTIAAIGTLPGKILSMYLTEGFFLGIAGSVAGIIAGSIIIIIINAAKVTFNFGMQEGLIINASLGALESIVIILTVLIVSIAGGFYPAYKASRMEPVQALKHV
jgi:putative ABC transport system permease protein